MYESAPRRTELRKFAVTLRDAPTWPVKEVPFELERAIFYSAVVLRKLIEDRKLTDSFAAEKLRVRVHAANAPEKSSWWRNMPGSVEFDWQNASVTDVAVNELCSQIVHLFGRYWWVDEDDELSGMVVCSHRHQDRQGFHIGFIMWAGLLEKAAKDWPTQRTIHAGGEHKVE
ncbi:hypothetical protein [Salibaculum griseiflavum]|uniref:Uncharacterized protein n=1 Tax=Salibaculum griseiflavum TaxID=1914409 RepID=A0A2V1PA27_9RHOB|nr:hypothetical protein [Salibaculum griseiflavum]PWG18187.1 hypothetical protein DFK10_02745 [Salibaculum griseiflavum]